MLYPAASPSVRSFVSREGGVRAACQPGRHHTRDWAELCKDEVLNDQDGSRGVYTTYLCVHTMYVCLIPISQGLSLQMMLETEAEIGREKPP